MATVANKTYDGAVIMGKVQMGFSVLACTIIAIVLIIVAYYNNKDWNYNLVNITGTVVSINTPNGDCLQNIQNDTNRSIIYNYVSLVLDPSYLWRRIITKKMCLHKSLKVNKALIFKKDYY